MFPPTINSVKCLWSVVDEQMSLPKSRLAVALGMKKATPDQQMFLFATGLLERRLHLISQLHHC